MALLPSEQRHLASRGDLLHRHQKITFGGQVIVTGSPEARGPPDPAPYLQPHLHQTVGLIREQPYGSIGEERHEVPADHGGQHHEAPVGLVQIGHLSHHRDHFAPVAHEGHEPIVVQGETPVGIGGDDGELHVAGHGAVGHIELVDGGAFYKEAGLVRTVDEPQHERNGAQDYDQRDQKRRQDACEARRRYSDE